VGRISGKIHFEILKSSNLNILKKSTFTVILIVGSQDEREIMSTSTVNQNIYIGYPNFRATGLLQDVVK